MYNSNDNEISLDSKSSKKRQSTTPEEIENDRLLKVLMNKYIKFDPYFIFNSE